MPRKSRFFLTDTNKGDKRHQKIINSIAIRSLRTLSSGMMAGLTSPARRWFRLSSSDQEVSEFRSVKDWLFQCEERMRNKYNRSNLYNILPGFYKELGAFGTAAFSMLEDPQETFRFYPFTIGSYWIGLNYNLVPDTFSRQFRMTARQMMAQFGRDNVSQSVRSLYDAGNTEAWVDMIHMVRANESRDASMADNRNMRFRAGYWEQSAGDYDQYARQEGFNEFPLLIARWDVTGEDIYGSSPGMDALGDMRAIQLQEKRKAQALDKVVSPPMVADATTRLGRGPSLLPDGITFVSNLQNGGGLRPAYEVRPDLNAIREDIYAMEKRIEQAFYSDLFMLTINSDRRDVTATEIAERHEEKLMALGPILERLNDEVFDPLIERTMGIMFRAGELPPPPREMQGQELKVEYINMLSQSQRLIQSSSTERFAQFVSGLAAMNPTVMDKWDMDETVDTYATDVGVAPKIVRTDDEVAEIRAGRQQAEQAAKTAAMTGPMNEAASAMKTISEIQPADGGSVADQFQQVMSQGLGG